MLRLSEAAARLGVSPATLRSYCDRGLVRFREMPNGERRFEEDALNSFREAQTGRQQRKPPEPAESDDETVSERPRSRPKWKERVPPWERQALAAESEVKIERARQEVERLRAEEESRRSETARASQALEAEQLERSRLVGLKQAGRNAVPWYPTELQRHLLPEIDEWVTSRSVPAYLSPAEQRNLVTSFVLERTAVFNAERKKQADREASERAQRDRAQAELDRIEREKIAKATTASLQRAVEDRELDQMEADYQKRRAMIGIVRMLKQ